MPIWVVTKIQVVLTNCSQLIIVCSLPTTNNGIHQLLLVMDNLLILLCRCLECICPMQNELTCLDLDCIISMLVGRRTATGIIRIDEAALENYSMACQV